MAPRSEHRLVHEGFAFRFDGHHDMRVISSWLEENVSTSQYDSFGHWNDGYDYYTIYVMFRDIDAAMLFKLSGIMDKALLE